jgi:hypothetical protein
MGSGDVSILGVQDRECANMTDMCPCCPLAAVLTVSSMSCPSIVRSSIRRPMDTGGNA